MEQYILLNRTETDYLHCWGPFPTREEANTYQSRIGDKQGRFQVVPLTIVQTANR